MDDDDCQDSLFQSAKLPLDFLLTGRDCSISSRAATGVAGATVDFFFRHISLRSRLLTSGFPFFFWVPSLQRTRFIRWSLEFVKHIVNSQASLRCARPAVSSWMGTVSQCTVVVQLIYDFRAPRQVACLGPGTADMHHLFDSRKSVTTYHLCSRRLTDYMSMWLWLAW